jgi:ComF family protein
MIHSLKYQNTKEIADTLARLCLHHVGGKTMTVVPVPLHPKRLAKRGFNQAEVLAERMGLFVQLILKRVKNTISQTGLSRFAREQNVEGAFVCTQSVGGEILLVDDVATTGATMNECARVLKRAGATKVYGLVVARG